MSASDPSQHCVLHGCSNKRHSRYLCNRHYHMAKSRGVLGQLPMSWPYGGKAAPPSAEAVDIVTRLLADGGEGPAPAAAADETLPPRPTTEETEHDQVRRRLDEVQHELAQAYERLDDALLRASKATSDRGAMSRKLSDARKALAEAEGALEVEKVTAEELRKDLDVARSSDEAWGTVNADALAAVEAERDELKKTSERLASRAAQHLDDLRTTRGDLGRVGERAEKLEAEQVGLRGRLVAAIERRNTDVLGQWARSVDVYDDLTELHGMTRAGLRELMGSVDMGRAVAARLVSGADELDGGAAEALLATVFDALREAVECLVDNVELMGLAKPTEQPTLLAVPTRTPKPIPKRVATLTFYDEPPPAPSVPEVCRLLGYAGVRATEELVRGWSSLQRAEAHTWADAQLTHLLCATNPPPAPAMPPWLALVHSRTQPNPLTREPVEAAVTALKDTAAQPPAGAESAA